MTIRYALPAILLLLTGTASAQTTVPAAPSPPAQPSAASSEGSAYDRIWRLFATIYDDPDGRVVQRVVHAGRFQHEFATVDAEQGDASEWNTRRLRVGPRLTLFRTFTVYGQLDLNPQEHDPLYLRLTDVYVQWNRSSRVVLTVGKHSIPFTMDGATSSTELLTIDRSNLANNLWFPQEYLPGASVSGKASRWSYRGGLYSSGGANREFGDFSGGTSTLAVLGYDFGEALGVKEAVLAGNYVYQTPDRNNTFTRPFEHIASANLKLDATSWGLRTDLSAGAGYLGQSDVWGMTLMPYVNITPKLQAIARYTLLDSQDPNGVLLATYESRVVRGRGDRYDEMYAGVNYFFYGHKLKLQSGLQFIDMDDSAGDGGEFTGTSWTTGLRVSW
jgi:phosphate-selective porin OprO/OprP